jgi:hypothetical protein
MSRKPAMLQKALTVSLMITVSSFYTLVPVTALAQTGSKASGELSVSGPVTINGTAAISGATIFSDSTIKTSHKGSATVNLGKLGRVQLGPESEMLVRFSDGMVGGNLAAGRAVASTPAGVSVSIATREGTAVADGKQASVLTIDVTCGNTRVMSTRGDATVTSNGKVESVAAGHEVAVGQASQAPRCTRLTTSSFGTGLSSGALAALLIAGAGLAVAGIIAATQSDEVTNSSIVVSGFRP